MAGRSAVRRVSGFDSTRPLPPLNFKRLQATHLWRRSPTKLPTHENSKMRRSAKLRCGARAVASCGACVVRGAALLFWAHQGHFHFQALSHVIVTQPTSDKSIQPAGVELVLLLLLLLWMEALFISSRNQHQVSFCIQ